jgi:hypothetical protein
MSAGVVSGVASAQQQNQIANAVKAFGTVVTVEPDEFLKIAGLQTQPLIAVAEGGFFKTTHQYLTSYKGLAFFTKSPTPLTLQPDAQVIKAASIKVPD